LNATPTPAPRRKLDRGKSHMSWFEVVVENDAQGEKPLFAEP